MAPKYPKVCVDDPFAVPPDTLGMDVEEMRRLGHKVVDMVIDRAMRRNEEPAILTGDPADLLGKLGGPLPETPMDPDASLELMAEVALSNQQHGDHPRYFARVPTSRNSIPISSGPRLIYTVSSTRLKMGPNR